MGERTTVILPQTQRLLNQMGKQIRLARLRRQLTAELVAERAGISRATLSNIEKGSPSVAIGSYAAVLHALNGMDKETLVRIMTEPKNSIIKQYETLFSLDGVELKFEKKALEKIADLTIERKTGVRGLQIKIAPTDLINFVGAEVGELSVEME